MGFLDPAVSDYLTELAAHQRADATLDDMESRAREHGFPIVGRAVGVFLELIVRSLGAQRVMELGSGYGYSAYWFARAVGATGHVICTDGDARNAQLAERYLTAADL
ncbi:MAG TPA: hypothetical protein VML96_13840, partial [Egibacteraceae bacterium]|nr:hypothetical protein [Egibacteraceae bacterium]